MDIYTITDQLNPNNPLVPLDIKQVTNIIIHHAASLNDYTWQNCNQDHKGRGWSCCGYNEIIYRNGDVYICRDLNIGAHCLHMNDKSYGICLIGNYDTDYTVPESQFNSLVKRIKDNKRRLPYVVEIGKHSQYGDTSCPGQHFPWDMLIEFVSKVEFTTQDDINLLAKNKVINSPEYWILHAKFGECVRGDYTEGLIKNMADFIRRV